MRKADRDDGEDRVLVIVKVKYGRRDQLSMTETMIVRLARTQGAAD
jgi:hypothetical protein